MRRVRALRPKLARKMEEMGPVSVLISALARALVQLRKLGSGLAATFPLK